MINSRHIALLGVVIIVIGAAAFIVFNQNEGGSFISPSNGDVFCTQEAKQCSDGSYVGRTGPNCEFALCPNKTSSDNQIKTSTTLTGAIKKGQQVGKEYCSEGLYIETDDGKVILLRTDQSTMFSDATLAGQNVEITGKYLAQEDFCEALICGCEDYVVIESMNTL